ncbi:MAG: FkbM family methyltransferase [Planctomycetota bacterium]
MIINPIKYRTCEVTWRETKTKLRSYRKDHITRSLKRGHYYEDEFLSHIADTYGGPGMFVDVGAFVGNHPVFYAKHCGCDAVVAFEPFPETFRLLQHNVSRNELDKKVVCVNKALGDAPGHLKMLIHDRRNRGMNRIDQAGDVRVEVSTLDRELAGNSMPIRFLKIDAEGHGLEVIHGGREVILKHRPAIAIEVEGDTLEPVTHLLGEMGYEAKGVHNGTPTWIFESE